MTKQGKDQGKASVGGDRELKPDAKQMGAILKRLRSFHEQGRRSLEDFPDRMGYGALKEFTADGRVGEAEQQRKARAFAHPKTGYTTSELEHVIARCERQGFPIGLSHVIRLLSIPKGPTRTAMQNAAIDGRWSRRRLDAEIRASQGRKQQHGVGRRARPPADANEALYRLSRQCEQWRRLASVLLLPGKAAKKVLPHALSVSLRTVSQQVAEFGEQVDRRLTARSAGETRLSTRGAGVVSPVTKGRRI